ncbi:MAG: SH3 domain-containing protein [Aggregatilineales bacterium]
MVELPPTATLLPIPGQLPQDTATPVPSRTPLPTFTFTPTETSIPPTNTLSPTPTITPTIGGIIESLQRVNVREGPGTNFSAVEALDAGTGIQILGKDDEAGAWYNIRLEDGTEGWIASRLVRVEPTPTTLPSPTPSPDLTALALGTPLPTAIIGGGTVTPTPPLSISTATPVGFSGSVAQVAEETPDPDAPTATATESFIPVVGFPDVNLSSINMTATALVGNAATLTPSVTSEAAIDRVITISPDDSDENEDNVDTNATIAAADADNTPSDEDTVPVVTQENADETLDSNTPLPTATLRPRQGVRVFAFCDNGAYGVARPAPIAAGSDIQIYWAWFARTVAQVNSHIDNANFEVRLNGDEIDILDEYRREIGREGIDYVAYWYIPVENLAAGTYEITYSVSWDEAITDGYQSYGPETGNPFEQETCTFEVR